MCRLRLIGLLLLSAFLLLLGAAHGGLLAQGAGSLPKGVRFVGDHIIYEVTNPYEVNLVGIQQTPHTPVRYRLVRVVYHEHVEYGVRNFSALRHSSPDCVEIVDSIPGYTLNELLDGCWQDTLWLGNGYIKGPKDFAKLQQLNAKNIVVDPLPPGVVNCGGVYYSADKHLLLYYGKRVGDYYQLPYQVDTVGFQAISEHATCPLIASDRLRHFKGYAAAMRVGYFGDRLKIYAASAASYDKLSWDNAPNRIRDPRVELVVPEDVYIDGPYAYPPKGFQLAHAQGKPAQMLLGIELQGGGSISLRERSGGRYWNQDSVVYDASTSQKFRTGTSLRVRALPAQGQRFVAFTYLGDTIYQSTFHLAPWFEGSKLTAIFAPQGQPREGFDYRIVSGRLVRYANNSREQRLVYTPQGNETAIAPAAFLHGDSLLALELPEQIARLEQAALFNMTSLLLLRLRGKDVKLSPGALVGCRGLRALVLDSTTPTNPEQLRSAFAPMPLPKNLVVYLPPNSPYATQPLPLGVQLLPESFTLTNREADKLDMQVEYRPLGSKVWLKAPVAPEVPLPIFSEYKLRFAPTERFAYGDKLTLDGQQAQTDTPYRIFADVVVAPTYRNLYNLLYVTTAKGRGDLEFLDLHKHPLIPKGRAKAGSKVLIVPKPGKFYQLDLTSLPATPYHGDTLIFTVPDQDYDFKPQFIRPTYTISTDPPTPEAHWNVLLNGTIILAHSENEVRAGDQIKVSLHPASHRIVEALSINGDLVVDGRTSFDLTVDKNYDFQATTLQKQCLVSISEECRRYWVFETTSTSQTLEDLQRVPWGEELRLKPTKEYKLLPRVELLLNGQSLENVTIPIKVEGSMAFDVKPIPSPVSLFVPVSALYVPSVPNMTPVRQDPYYVYTWTQIPQQPIPIDLLHQPGVQVKAIVASDGTQSKGAQISLPMAQDQLLWPIMENVAYHLHIVSNKRDFLEVLTESNHRLQDKGILYYGQQLRIEVHPHDGYRLMRLVVNGFLRPRQSQQLTVRQDVTIEAQFEKF